MNNENDRNTTNHLSSDFSEEEESNSILHQREETKDIPLPEDESYLCQWLSPYTNSECNSHDGQKICGHCDKCAKPVCSKCIIKICNSEGHKVTDIGEAIEQRRKAVEKMLAEVKDIKLQSLKSMLMEINRKQEENEGQSKDLSNEINTKIMTELSTSIQKTVEEYDEQIQSTKSENTDRLHEARDPIQDCINDAEGTLAKVHESLRQSPGLQIFEIEKTLQGMARRVDTTLGIQIPRIKHLTLNRDPVNPEYLGKLFGSLTTDESTENENLEYLAELKVEGEFSIVYKGILNISPISASRAWVLCCSPNSTKVLQFDKTGEEMGNIHLKELSVSSISICQNYLYIALPDEKRVASLPLLSFPESNTVQRSSALPDDSASVSSQLKTVLEFGALKPYGLATCSTSCTQVWVGLVDKLDFKPKPGDSKRMIACYSIDGTKIYSVQNDNYSGSPLFTIPRRLAVNNINHNVATINLLSKSHGEVILTNNVGSVLAIYPERSTWNVFSQAIAMNLIYPTDISFTQLGDIVFSDNHNKCITILDQECKNVLRYFQGFECYALGSFIGGGMSTCIWLGDRKDKVSVCSYLGLKENRSS